MKKLFVKFAIIVALTVFISNMEGKMQLTFAGYEIYMHSALFGVLALLFVIVVWKMARWVDWLVYVPQKFLTNKKINKKTLGLESTAIALMTKNTELLDTSLNKIKETLGKDNQVYKIINARLENKNKRISELRNIMLDNKTSPELKQIIAMEIVAFGNEKITQQTLESITVDGDLPGWANVYKAHNEKDYEKAKAFLELAKIGDLSANSYMVNLALLQARQGKSDFAKSIVFAWKKISKDKYINLYIPHLLKSACLVKGLNAGDFKSIEKSVSRQSWQGCLLISALAIKVPLYGVAKDYISKAEQLDGDDVMIDNIKTELSLARWDKISDKEKQKIVAKSINYTFF